MIFLVLGLVAQRGDLGDWLHASTGKAEAHNPRQTTPAPPDTLVCMGNKTHPSQTNTHIVCIVRKTCIQYKTIRKA